MKKTNNKSRIIFFPGDPMSFSQKVNIFNFLFFSLFPPNNAGFL